MLIPSKTKETRRFQVNPNEVAVSVNNVSKKFCKNLKHSMAYGIINLSQNLMGFKPQTAELRKSEFWAIDDISFELKQGEVLGLIGMNGSGKSTILRMLTGIFPPDKGEIRIKGRVGALIAIGAGFHPHMTGRENIYLNGTILGMTRREINSKFQGIVDFAEIGDFLESPVATYSSGMRVRLGFSVAVHMDPDVMLIDEVLAVGDFNFRQKCAEKINTIRRNSAVVLVSHNMRDILMLCNRSIVMQKGRIAYLGSSRDAVEFYLDGMNKHKTVSENKVKGSERDTHGRYIYGELFDNRNKIAAVSHQWVDREGKPVPSIAHGDAIALQFSFRLLFPPENLIIGVPIFNQGQLFSAMNTDSKDIKIDVGRNGYVRGRLEIDYMAFNPGRYTAVFTVLNANEFLYRNIIGDFVVESMPVEYGVVTLKHYWHFEKS